jgi:hypothetical protein
MPYYNITVTTLAEVEANVRVFAPDEEAAELAAHQQGYNWKLVNVIDDIEYEVTLVPTVEIFGVNNDL